MKLSVLASIDDENAGFSTFSEQSGFFLRVGRHADSLGYSTIFLFKNSATKKNAIGDPLLLQATLAPAVQSLRLGVGFAPFSFLDPMSLADSCATLDVVSGGRVTIAIDDGVRLRKQDAINLDLPHQDRQTRENRDFLRNALRGERFSSRSVNRRATNLQISVRPLQTPHPPIYVAVYDRAAAEEAGSAGYRMFLSPLAGVSDMGAVSALVDGFRLGQKKAGLTQGEDDIVAFCLAHADADHNRAVDTAHAAFNRHALVRPTWVCRNFETAMGLSYFLVGGPTILQRKLRQMSDIGINHISLIPTFGGLTIESTLDTMQIMADTIAGRADNSAPLQA